VAPSHTSPTLKKIPDAGLDTATAAAAILEAARQTGIKSKSELSLCICPRMKIQKHAVSMEVKPAVQ